MDRWRGKWALITGASAGLGTEFAKLLAAGGTNLVLTARRRDRLDQLASELSAKHGVKVEVVPSDLAQPESPAKIHAITSARDMRIDLLINNAGFGVYGALRSSDFSRQLEMVQVNCAAVVHLTHLFLPGMIERRGGDILILASTAAFQAVPYISVYAATKSFDLLFAEGLAEEVRQFGVHVCALCPGSTNTEFQQVAGQPDRVFRHAETAEKVARVGLEALAKGKSAVISGFSNKFSTVSQRLVPRSFVTRMAGKMFAPPQQ
jgi:short-subunit dehydrogenase